MTVSKINTAQRIYQGIIYVTLTNGVTFNKRVSRNRTANIVRFWRNYPLFKYAKIHEIINYKKGTNHVQGRKIGYFGHTYEYFDPNGIFETQKSQEYTNNLNK